LRAGIFSTFRSEEWRVKKHNGSGQPNATGLIEAPIWDLPVRLFHWSLVIAIAVSWLSGQFEWLGIHYWSGLATIGLISFRILWGFFGTPTARFAQFVRGPIAAISYLRGAFTQRAPSYSVGHNPAGGLMVVMLLAVAGIQALSGLVNTDDVLFDGPLRDDVPGWLASALSWAHRPLSNLLLALIALHLVAIAVYRLVKRENLVIAMITGRAKLPRAKAEVVVHGQSFGRNLLLRAIFCAIVGAAVPAAIHLLN
jgi:cytochrome b